MLTLQIMPQRLTVCKVPDLSGLAMSGLVFIGNTDYDDAPPVLPEGRTEQPVKEPPHNRKTHSPADHLNSAVFP
jgi:hypothetical protein